MDKFEYHQTRRPNFNELGLAGWDMIGLEEDTRTGEFKEGAMFYFKRKLDGQANTANNEGANLP